ncbi:YigZ family protein [Methanosarcina sp.]|uniref:IMPACT family protein n=1 Tax=Methanosarcina sp. TaxID=2213 RepID=UPI00298922E1|nr:YigZ family protein [Methanosarcina sp.]MDW5550551.1 YigZ family protein [Methanosarcina sp.]MDW5554255.1 YigZ family protein [Methanosarcina sp.]MDW5559615.1 YigZ family protein [Methanosarcina sp.]
MKSYKTLKHCGKAQNEFKNSLFIGYARPVESEADAKAFIKGIKELHRDANHNVSAYFIKEKSSFALKYDDDGEPSGSSGKPVFKILESKEILNAAVAVTRYFGGIKLGFGGLSRAYRDTALLAIEEAEIIEVFEQVRLKIRIGYAESKKVRNLIEKYAVIQEETYSDNVEFVLLVIEELEDEFIKKITDQTKNKVAFEKL